MWKFKVKDSEETIIVDANAKTICERYDNLELVGEVDEKGEVKKPKKEK